jgi:hypothetical protein
MVTSTQRPSAGGCFVSPGSCGFPDPAYGNVGVPAGTTLTPSGSLNVTTPGAVIDGKDVTGTIRINANNVTIKNTKVENHTDSCGANTCGNSLILVNGNYNVTVSHVELTADQNASIEHAIRNVFDGSHLTIDHVYQHGLIDALCHCGNVDVSDTYSNVGKAIPDDHVENMYVEDKTVSVTHSVLINRISQTANIFMDSGAGNHLTLKNSMLAGGGFSMYVCPKNGCSTATAMVTGNMFTRCGHGAEVPGISGSWNCPNGVDDYGLFPRSGSYGWAADMPAQTVWSGNVWDDDGSPVGSP